MTFFLGHRVQIILCFRIFGEKNITATNYCKSWHRSQLLSTFLKSQLCKYSVWGIQSVIFRKKFSLFQSVYSSYANLKIPNLDAFVALFCCITFYGESIKCTKSSDSVQQKIKKSQLAKLRRSRFTIGFKKIGLPFRLFSSISRLFLPIWLPEFISLFWMTLENRCRAEKTLKDLCAHWNSLKDTERMKRTELILLLVSQKYPCFHNFWQLLLLSGHKALGTQWQNFLAFCQWANFSQQEIRCP